jgi:hypothetical protein
MSRLIETLGLLGALACLMGWLGVRPGHPANAAPAPIIVPVPVQPSKPDDTARRRHPLRPHRAVEAPAPDGTEPMVDYPKELWFRNIGSRIDGAGMCVFTSFEFTCLWSGLDEFHGFRDWCAQRYPGGGYPEKLAKLVKAYCTAKQIPRERFDPDRDLIQYEGADPTWIESCLKNGWLPGVTLYRSPRYGGGTIYHMTCCAFLGPKWGCTLDNNFWPLEWAPRDEWLRRIKLQGRYWAFAVISPGPPPSPTN